MDIPSLKKYLTQEFFLMPANEQLKDYKFIIMTAVGTIIGTPVVDKELESGVIKSLYELTLHVASEYRQEYSIAEDTPTSGNDGFLVIKDVKIINLYQTNQFPFLVVFYDQIIGVTFGKID